MSNLTLWPLRAEIDRVGGTPHVGFVINDSLEQAARVLRDITPYERPRLTTSNSTMPRWPLADA
jgi:hypothetical protein